MYSTQASKELNKRGMYGYVYNKTFKCIYSHAQTHTSHTHIQSFSNTHLSYTQTAMLKHTHVTHTHTAILKDTQQVRSHTHIAYVPKLQLGRREESFPANVGRNSREKSMHT